MRARIAWLCIVVAGAFIFAEGCADEDTSTNGTNGTNTNTGGSGGDPGPRPAGARCACDVDCDGDQALCLLGICMQRAAAFCDVPSSELGCAPGFRCFNSDIVLDTGVCWPVYDAATCEGVENRHGLCSPVRGDVCDATCGVACVPDSVPPQAIGSQCGNDAECAAGGEPMCYSEQGSKVDRFIDGYCMYFGCSSDAECGEGGVCPPLAADGGGVCLNSCGMDLDCRSGYVCRYFEDEVTSACWGGCDAAATCPGGYACAGNYCIDAQIACAPDNPYGECPKGLWCDDGVCSDEPFVCSGGEADALEPNDTLETAAVAPLGITNGLSLCEGEEDWFEVTVPAQTILRVGIEFLHTAGDIDLVVYDDAGVVFASRANKSYPYSSYRTWYETDPEYYGLYSEAGGDKFYLRVVGYQSAQNQYSLHIDELPYVDGPDCQGAGFTSDECTGYGADGTGLLPFPYPDPNDSYVGGGYRWENAANYRFARRELIMLVRHALKLTMDAFPGTTPLGVGDVSDFFGITPGFDVDDPAHPETTHDQGGNHDMAYFQTDGNNDIEIVCNDGSVHNDGFCGPTSVNTHVVDLPRQAFFMAKLSASPRLRTIGVDKYMGPLIETAAADLFALADGDPTKISSPELSAVIAKMSYGDDWPYHHHHIHVSLQWWASADYSPPTGSDAAQAFSQSRVGPRAERALPLAPMRRSLLRPLPSRPLR